MTSPRALKRWYGLIFFVCAFTLPGRADGNIITQPSDDDSECRSKTLQESDLELRRQGYIFISEFNVTIVASRDFLINHTFVICFNQSEDLMKQILDICEPWGYDPDEYRTQVDGSISLVGDNRVLLPGSYVIEDDQLFACPGAAVKGGNLNHPPFRTVTDSVSIYIGQVGSAISLISLLVHLVIFYFVPTLKNLPGYTLISLSLAYLFAFSFVLFGQIPSVLGVPCVISGVLQQLFFLVAFFCMNVMAFDIWKTLKLATEQLIISNQETKKREYVFYTLYSWGIPIAITTLSVVADYTDVFPRKIKPEFGKNDLCGMGNNAAKIVFFSIPAFTVFILNGIFFVLSALMIKRNKMKCGSDQQRTAKLDFALYVRLALMMGVTWLICVVAWAIGNNVVWLAFDIMNSLQGFFLFLLFACSKKTFAQIKKRFCMERKKSADMSTNKITMSIELSS